MDIKIESENENKLFGRKEIHFTASYSGKTPSRDEVKEEICKKLSLKPDLTQVIKISQGYGNSMSEVSIYYYSTKEIMERLSAKRKKETQKPAAQPGEKKEEKKEVAEEKKETKEPAEAKKEEKKHTDHPKEEKKEHKEPKEAKKEGEEKK